ncbi:unnamed protein product [Paramecium sonneborni]|uniref:Uncharacterized protein n=1 Tax=Paramecium sonneborni TaxID=65129 RepID=A0A8S1KN43_9CILI|nr:unnamed protein product [Paramecium sonneborni]
MINLQKPLVLMIHQSCYLLKFGTFPQGLFLLNQDYWQLFDSCFSNMIRQSS